MPQFSDYLLANGLVTSSDLEQSLQESRSTGRTLGQVLVDRGIVPEVTLVKFVAAQLGMPFYELADLTIDGSALALVTGPMCRRYSLIPVGFDQDRLIVAMSDPSNVVALDDLRSTTGRDVVAGVSTRTDIVASINRHYRSEGELDDISLAIDAEEEVFEDLSTIKQVSEDAPIVKYVNLLITQAINDRASDIHLEPTEHDLRVRFRIDGVLHEVMHSPKSIQHGVISRLKIMADMNIAERRIPQDGRLSVNAPGGKVDLRVATLPTVWGEKVVMRILDNSTAMLTLEQLGFSAYNYERFSRSFTKPYGMLLVVGPTGSGKSTTLYATLNILNRPEVNIITVEDPVEYRLPGINQVQTHVKAGLTFAAALRSILRSDPDIVLIGEVRDYETAQIAVESALTGHLVLTTLHTNDAPSAVTRLVEMGVEPFLVGSAVDCVLAQRLARRLCSKCKEPYTPVPDVLIAARFPWQEGEPLPTLYQAVGCPQCSRTGYRGRLALHEIMPITPAIERLAAERASANQVEQVAKEQGMISLRDDGMAKVLSGLTSLEEVLRVVV
ncbi:MAG: type pilus assembly protein PilB [Actinomycetota bacterium]|nr:type pilus assembly protein PilB [Actinomycetota bacterium]